MRFQSLVTKHKVKLLCETRILLRITIGADQATSNKIKRMVGLELNRLRLIAFRLPRLLRLVQFVLNQTANRLALPCDSNSPSEGEPGGNPKPRKSSAVSVMTDEDTMKGRNVMVATMAFGSRCRNMITALDTPSARAAMMYSKLRPRKNSARTRPTSETHENNRRMPSRTKKPGTSTDDRIKSRYSEGIAVQTSMKRWKARSIQPPKYPCTPP